MATYKPHLIKATTPPSAAPTEVSQHYINTAAKKIYLSVGTSSVNDWKEIKTDFGTFDTAVENLTNSVNSKLPATYTQINTDNARALINSRNIITVNGTTHLPLISNLAVGSYVTFLKFKTLAPTIDTTDSANIILNKGTDTAIIYNINSEITFVFNGTAWDCIYGN